MTVEEVIKLKRGFLKNDLERTKRMVCEAPNNTRI